MKGYSSWSEFRCHRQIAGRPAPNLCGCNLCVGQISRKYNRRQERARWRNLRAGLLQMVDLEDVDVPPIIGTKYGYGW